MERRSIYILPALAIFSFSLIVLLVFMSGVYYCMEGFLLGWWLFVYC